VSGLINVKTRAFSDHSIICVECLFFWPDVNKELFARKVSSDRNFSSYQPIFRRLRTSTTRWKRGSLTSYPFLRYSCLLCGEQLAVRTANPLCTFQVFNNINLNSMFYKPANSRNLQFIRASLRAHFRGLNCGKRPDREAKSDAAHGLAPLQHLTVGSDPARFKVVSPCFPARSSGCTWIIPHWRRPNAYLYICGNLVLRDGKGSS